MGNVAKVPSSQVLILNKDLYKHKQAQIDSKFTGLSLSTAKSSLIIFSGAQAVWSRVRGVLCGGQPLRAPRGLSLPESGRGQRPGAALGHGHLVTGAGSHLSLEPLIGLGLLKGHNKSL